MRARLAPVLAFALAALPCAAPAQEGPARVVSMNLCTDQLALLLAAPGQLVSVSHLAVDPVSSVMAGQVGDIPLNHGQAEEIALFAPDLVLAGAYGAGDTVRMLERLGHPVLRFAPETSLEDLRANLLRMGAVLGQSDKAAALVATLDAELAAIAARPASGKVAALYYSGGYTEGTASLGHAIIAAAGLDNLAARLGLDYGGVLSLEEIILNRPDVIVLGQAFAGHSQGEAMLQHPVLAAARAGGTDFVTTTPAWTCGTPEIAPVIAALAAIARAETP